MKAITTINSKQRLLIFFFYIGSIGCSKPAKDEANYGCGSQAVLETLVNTPGVLVYNSTQAEWWVSIDLGSGRQFSASFCDKSAYDAKVAGQPTTASIPVTVSGQVKKKMLEPDTGKPHNRIRRSVCIDYNCGKLISQVRTQLKLQYIKTGS